MTLTDLPNISKVISADLYKAGINTVEELKALGSKEAFIRIKKHSDPEACISKLYALEGALRGIRWHGLTEATKSDLKDFYKTL